MDYFIKKNKKEVETLDWGNLTRLSGPKKTNAKDLVVIEVNIAPGQGHDFHKHPKQEEVIYVVMYSRTMGWARKANFRSRRVCFYTC